MVQMVSEPGSCGFIEPLSSIVSVAVFYTSEPVRLRMICQSGALFIDLARRLNEIIPLNG